MHKNIDKTINRGKDLVTLDKRGEDLNQTARQFVKKTKEIKRKMWWKNCKVSISSGNVCYLVHLFIGSKQI